MKREQKTSRSFSSALMVSTGFVLLLWLIHSFSVLFHVELWNLGVKAQELSGLLGILFAPLIHASWAHLASNSPALITLGVAMIYGYPRATPLAILGIWLGGDLFTWLFARQGVFHFGASGITHGLMFFLFTIGILRRDRLSIALSMIVFFLYGSMVWGVFPNDPKISFEMHAFGALFGVFMAFILRKIDVAMPRKHYDWEDENDVVDTHEPVVNSELYDEDIYNHLYNKNYYLDKEQLEIEGNSEK